MDLATQILQLKSNAVALRNMADLVIAQADRMLASDPAGRVTKKRVLRQVDLTTRLLSGTTKPAKKKA